MENLILTIYPLSANPANGQTYSFLGDWRFKCYIIRIGVDEIFCVVTVLMVETLISLLVTIIVFTVNQVINPFYTTGLFLYPLKISENLCFSDVFRGYRKRSVACHGIENNYNHRAACRIYWKKTCSNRC